VIILATTDGPALAKKLVRDAGLGFRPAIQHTNLTRNALSEFQNAAQPVRWWNVVMPVTTDAGDIATVLKGDSVRDPSSNRLRFLTVRDGSRIRSNIRYDMAWTIIIVDMSKTGGAPFGVLADLIRSRGLGSQVLVFTRTKLTAAQLARKLERVGIPSDAIHGDKTQQERINALDAFKANKITALVATDVAARGLDIDQLPLVVNYELPTNAEDYVHRIGRTGRAGASGEAVSLVDGAEERRLVEIEKLLKREFPREQAAVSVAPRATPGQRPAQPATPSHAHARTHAHAKKPAADDWFMKPYEPSTNATKIEEQSSFGPDKPKKQLAALLCRPPEKR